MKVHRRILLFIFFCVAVATVVFGNVSHAGYEYQRCDSNSSCILGEYVYANDGSVVTTNSCSVDISNPSGGLIVDNGATSFESDGWHAYTYSTGSSTGLYRSVMCCTVATDTACIDKSFIVGTTFTDVAAIRSATFDFKGTADSGTVSTLTDAELTQPDNYWNNYTVVMLTGSNAGEEQTVSGFNSATDTLTFSSSFTNAISTDDYVLRRDQSLAAKVWTSTTRTLSSFGTLASDVWSVATRRLTDSTLTGGGSLVTQSSLDSAKTDIVAEVNENQTAIGNLNDISAIDVWNVDSGLLIASDSIGMQVATNVDATVSSRSSQTSVDAMQTDVTAIQATLNVLSTKIDTIDTVVDAIYAQQQTGATTGLPAETYALLEDVSNDLNSISGDKGYNLDDIYKTSANVDLSDLKDIKNRMLALQAMVEFNNLLIDKVANEPMVKSWLEWGSVVLKMLVVNPSQSQTQTISFKYYMPREADPKLVIDKEDLQIDYDQERELWYVHKDITLKAGESVVKTVELKDVWIVSEEEVTSLKKQVADLMEPLVKTSYFAQGSTLKSDTERLLDDITSKQKEYKASPEEHIVTYRENVEKLQAAKNNIEALKALVAEVSGKGSLQGSLFGVSTVMTWSIIVIVVIAASFLMILLYVLLSKHRAEEKLSVSAQGNENVPLMKEREFERTKEVENHTPITARRLPWFHFVAMMSTKKENIKRILIYGLGIIALAVVVFLAVRFIPAVKEKLKNDSSPSIMDVKELNADEGTIVTLDSNESGKSTEAESAIKEENADADVKSDADKVVGVNVGKIQIVETGTGWLNVRTTPSLDGPILLKVFVGDEFSFVEKKDENSSSGTISWYKIVLADGKEGWVYGTYVKVLSSE